MGGGSSSRLLGSAATDEAKPVGREVRTPLSLGFLRHLEAAEHYLKLIMRPEEQYVPQATALSDIELVVEQLDC